MLICSLIKYVSDCFLTTLPLTNSVQRTTVDESIDWASENAGVVESGSDTSKVHRTMPNAIGGDSVNGSLKPASGSSCVNVIRSLITLVESFLTLVESFFTLEESFLTFAESFFTLEESFLTFAESFFTLEESFLTFAESFFTLEESFLTFAEPFFVLEGSFLTFVESFFVLEESFLILLESVVAPVVEVSSSMEAFSKESLIKEIASVEKSSVVYNSLLLHAQSRENIIQQIL